MKKRIIIISFSLLFIVSCTLNAVLFNFVVKTYRQQKRYQIDPANILQYHDSNKKIIGKRKNTTRIVLFGDSRIYQWNPLPELPGCEFINRGIPGETTSQAILRIDSDLVKLKPDIVIIQIGGNDCNSIGTLPEMESYITSNCKKNIGTIIAKLRKNHIKAIILSVFPFSTVDIYRVPVWSEKINKAVTEINRDIQNYNSADIRTIECDKIFIENNMMKESYAIDMLHINKSGYAKLTDSVRPILEELLTNTKRRN